MKKTPTNGLMATIAKCDGSHRPAPLTGGTVSETLAGHRVENLPKQDLDGRIEDGN
jgi:hypothetical protein